MHASLQAFSRAFVSYGVRSHPIRWSGYVLDGDTAWMSG